MDRKTLKYYLENKNFNRAPVKRGKKTENVLKVVDDQIIMNPIDIDQCDDEIVTSYTYLTKKVDKKRWTEQEERLFYKALEYCGSDFSLLNVLFPDRTRSNLKQKYKKEYKTDKMKIERALDSFKKFNIDKFNELKHEIVVLQDIQRKE